MQTFTAQPLPASQMRDSSKGGSSSSPFTNPIFLSTLVLPHLETYLAAHTSVRFLLLEYPPEHLATVLALQKLVGADVIKVAGIVVDEAAAAARQPSPASSPSIPDGIDSPSFATRSTQSNRPYHPLAFSKANLVLVSTATENEVATFVSTIWRMLMNTSRFYRPEQPPRPAVSPRTSDLYHSPSSPNLAAAAAASPPPIPRPTTGLSSPPFSPPAPYPARPVSPALSARSRISAMSGMSHRHRGDRPSASNKKPAVADPSSLSFVELATVVDDDDAVSEPDADERRLMPLFMRRQETRKGNSRKALKWLGLA